MRRGTRGGIVISWLVKLIVGLVLIGLVLFEGGAIIVATVGADGAASSAAVEAAFIYGGSSDAERAQAEATEKAHDGGATLVDFRISEDGRSITVTVRRRARTFITHRISSLRRFTSVEATAEAPVR